MALLRRGARLAPVVPILLLAAMAGSAQAAQLYRVTDFVPNGINAKDQVVGEITDLSDDGDGTVDGAGEWQITTTAPSGALTRLQGSGTQVAAINASGRMAGMTQQEDANSVFVTHAVTWSSPTGAPQVISPLTHDPDVYDYSYSEDISDTGAIVGQTEGDNPHGFTGFEWNNGSLSGVGWGNASDPAGDAYVTHAGAITADGSKILGKVDGAGGDHWYLWSGASPTAAGTPIDLTPVPSGATILGGFSSDITVMNDLAPDGAVLGYKGDVDDRTNYLRTADGTDHLLTGLAGYNAVNAKHALAGTIDVATGGGAPNLHAAVQQPDGRVVDLNSLVDPAHDNTLFDALAMNDNGDVAGVGYDDDGEYGFVLKMGYVVDSTGDQSDKDLTDGACLTAQNTCTLRAAIQQLNHDGSSTKTPVTFDVTGAGSGIPTIAPASPLPAITAPVDLDATTQPSPLVAGTRKIGAILDGTSAGASADGIELAAGAAGSAVRGLEVTRFGGDGVKLGGAQSTLADSVLVKDHVGAEVAADSVAVGPSGTLPGNVFFEDGDATGLYTYLHGLAGHRGADAFASAAPGYGAGILLRSASSGAHVMGNLIGVHGAGFNALDPDGPASPNPAVDTTLSAAGVLIAPGGAAVSGVAIDTANVISGDLIGVGTAGGVVHGLTVSGNVFGAAADGTSALPDFGGMFGLLAAGTVTGLDAESNRFQGELAGVTIAGTGVAAPSIHDNLLGDDADQRLPDVIAHGLGLHDVIGVLLADAEGVSVRGNRVLGDFTGIALGGDHLHGDAITANTIGSDEPPAFGALATADLAGLGGGFGVLYAGNASADGTAPAQDVVVAGNTIQGNAFGVLANGGTGLAVRGNGFTANALAVVDGGSAGTAIGTTDQPNTFTNDGFGVLLANTDPSTDDLRQAQVNPAVAGEAGKQAALGQPNEDAALGAVDALTTAGLNAHSADVSTIPGTGETVIGNRFTANSLPLTAIGDEHGLRIESNDVEHSRAAGIWLLGSASHHPTAQVLGNVIYDNENFTETNLTGIPGLGLDLVTSASTAPDATNVGGFGYGIDPQDRTQPDAGTNDVQNAPVLTEAAVGGGQMSVTGTLHGRPSMAYIIEVFADDAQNPFGAGEGQRAVGRLSVTTDGAGDADVGGTFPAPPAGARFVSATATTVPGGGAPGVTSEFSINVPVLAAAAPPAPQDGTPSPPAPGRPASPAPSGTATTGVTTRAGKVTTDGKGSITLPAVVTCSSVAAASCTVATTATIVPPSGGKAHKSAAVAKARKRPKPQTIGKGRLTLKPGAHGSVAIRLNASGLKALKRARTLTATVTVKVTGAGRRPIAKSFRLKLTYKKSSSTRKKGK
ncbi:MAG TPA: hypothetical protein VFG42_13895 [Baekduia sp.]|uniref:hypothetical protein n=1 Tax=Baekduia sp. TaxID=2600305 RepID=UPI002D7861F7|nr:hypothetical protein [Baekduia sp.]HET6507877.1 hypothetical protein [Baekduia sp.]